MFEGQKIAVFDAEIKKPIEKCSRGWQSHDEMGVSVLCVFDYESMRYRVFDDRTQREAIDLLKTRDRVVGYNTVGFDWKLLKASWPDAWAQQVGSPDPLYNYDILREIWLALGLNPDKFEPKTHGGWKLDDVAIETICMRKSGDGAKAPLLYEEGRLTEVIDYCLEDVRIERTLFEFVAKNGYVVRRGESLQVRRPFEPIQ